MKGQVKVSQEVFEGMEAIRQSGATNMLDMNNVKDLADQLGYYETYQWIDNVDRGTYAKAIFKGLTTE